jgi:hypothetical protein
MTSHDTNTSGGQPRRFGFPIVAIVAIVAVVALFVHGSPGRAYSGGDSNDDMVVFGGQHEVIKEGQEVRGDLVVIGGSAEVLGKVDGDAVALGGRIYVAPQGHVNGSLVNLGGVIDNESNVPQGHGAVPPPENTQAPPPPPAPEASSTQNAWEPGWLTFYLADAVLVFLAFLLFPGRTATTAAHLRENPMLAGILGFFSPIIFVLLVIALVITLVGIPLIPLAVIATIGGYLIGKAAIADFIGARIQELSKRAEPAPAVSVAIGLAVLFVVTAFTGWVGIVLYFCIVAMAIGAALYMLMRTAEAYRGRKTAAATATPTSMHFPVPTPPASPTPPVNPTTTPPSQ